VSGNPGGTSFNPLLIYGGVGLGKTHLAHAIGIEVKNRSPQKTVLYVTSEKFTNQFIDAVKNNAHNDFVQFYQMIDVLIIDDIQFFAGKERTQDVFFHIFNHLHQNGKQLILTCDKAPVDLQGMEHRLLSRFKWGLSADLQVADLETRIAILKRKMYLDGIELPNEIVDYIAYSITSNIRELEGALISIIAQASQLLIIFSAIGFAVNVRAQTPSPTPPAGCSGSASPRTATGTRHCRPTCCPPGSTRS
jgi:chromosomal replication initiator protein